jgi:hypothetical protein
MIQADALLVARWQMFTSTDSKKAMCVANDGGALALYQIMPDGSVNVCS